MMYAFFTASEQSKAGKFWGVYSSIDFAREVYAIYNDGVPLDDEENMPLFIEVELDEHIYQNFDF